MSHPRNWTLEYDDAAPPLPPEFEISESGDGREDPPPGIPPGAYLLWLDPVRTFGSSRHQDRLLVGVLRVFHRPARWALISPGVQAGLSYETRTGNTHWRSTILEVIDRLPAGNKLFDLPEDSTLRGEPIRLSASADLYSIERSGFFVLLEKLRKSKKNDGDNLPSREVAENRLKLLHLPRKDYRYYLRLADYGVPNEPTVPLQNPRVALGLASYAWTGWDDGWVPERMIYAGIHPKDIKTAEDIPAPEGRRHDLKDFESDTSNGFDTEIARLGLLRLTSLGDSTAPEPPNNQKNSYSYRKTIDTDYPQDCTKVAVPPLRCGGIFFHLQLEYLSEYFPESPEGGCAPPQASSESKERLTHWKYIGDCWQALRKAGWIFNFPEVDNKDTLTCEPSHKLPYREIKTDGDLGKDGIWTEYQLNSYHDRYIEKPSRQYLDHGILGRNRDSEDPWNYNFLLVQSIQRGRQRTVRGLMYDSGTPRGTDLPRQGAAVARHALPKDFKNEYAEKGFFHEDFKPFAFYLIHELGHMLGLYHGTDGIMQAVPFKRKNSISSIVADEKQNNTTSDEDIDPPEDFSPLDAYRLTHLPDHWVRPGGVPFGYKYRSAPLSILELISESPGLRLEMEPIHVCLGELPRGLVLRLTNHTQKNLLCPNNRHAQPDYGRLGVHLIHPSGRVEEAWPVHSPRELGSLGNSSLLRGETLSYHVRWDARWPELRQVGLYTVRVYLLWSVGEVPEEEQNSGEGSEASHEHPLEDDRTKAYRVSASGELRVLLHGPEPHHG